MQLASTTLARAAADYRWLLDRGYSPKSALKLVGDKRQMTGDERMILFRGMASNAASASRAAAIETVARGRAIYVDGYNQVLTVMHYLTGRPIFISSDGLVRDAGGSHGRIGNKTLFERAASALVDHIASLEPARVTVYLDSPISGSAGHAALIRSLFAAEGIEALLLLERSADAPLKAAPPGCLVASSDSAIADAIAATTERSGYSSVTERSGYSSVTERSGYSSVTERSGYSSVRLYDAARWTIQEAFGRPELLDLGRLLEEGYDAGKADR